MPRTFPERDVCCIHLHASISLEVHSFFISLRFYNLYCRQPRLRRCLQHRNRHSVRPCTFCHPRSRRHVVQRLCWDDWECTEQCHSLTLPSDHSRKHACYNIHDDSTAPTAPIRVELHRFSHITSIWVFIGPSYCTCITLHRDSHLKFMLLSGFLFIYGAFLQFLEINLDLYRYSNHSATGDALIFFRINQKILFIEDKCAEIYLYHFSTMFIKSIMCLKGSVCIQNFVCIQSKSRPPHIKSVWKILTIGYSKYFDSCKLHASQNSICCTKKTLGTMTIK